MPASKSSTLNMHRQALRFPVPSECLRIHPQGLGELRHGQMRVAIEGGPDLLRDDIKNVPNGRHGIGMHVSPCCPALVVVPGLTFLDLVESTMDSIAIGPDEWADAPSIPQNAPTRRAEIEAVRGIHHEKTRRVRRAFLIVTFNDALVVTPAKPLPLHKENRREDEHPRQSPHDSHHR